MMMRLSHFSVQLISIMVAFLLFISAIIGLSAYDQWKTTNYMWRQSAQAQAENSIKTWDAWLSQNQETLLAAKVVYEVSNSVQEDDFLQIIEQLEYSWKHNRTVEIGVVQRLPDGDSTKVIQSSIINPSFYIDAELSDIPLFNKILDVARNIDRMILLPAIPTDNENLLGVLVSAVNSKREQGIYVLSVLNFQDLIETLEALTFSTGLTAQISVQSDHQSNFLTLPVAFKKPALSKPVFNFDIRLVSMGAKWRFDWQVDERYQGGPDLEKFYLIILGGVLVVLLIAIFGYRLILEIQNVKQESLKRKEVEKQLKSIAHFDVVTELPNRFFIMKKLDSLINEVKHGKFLLAVCFIDLDDFKTVNDTFGHHAGDELLRQIGSRLKGMMRSSDELGRIGGDEFVLLSKTKSQQELFAMLERFKSYFAEPFEVDNELVSCGCSIGVATYPSCGTNADTLLRHADQAMFLSKQAGKGAIKYFNTSVDKAIRQKKEQILEIQQGMIKKQFVLFYQPKLDFCTGEIYGAEALIRWQCPDRGLIPPGDFLPLIEKSKVDIELGYYVLELALQQMNIWQNSGMNIEVSVNVSNTLLEASGFISKLDEILHKYSNVNPNNLQLEVLETVALSNIEHVKNLITACNNKGISIALDDFGTGYSSLSYLSEIQSQVIKIDKSFVDKLGRGQGSSEIIKAIIELAKIFNRKVIAEGVETKEQGSRLIELGCDQGQGYYIARPMPADEFQHWHSQFKMAEAWQVEQ